MGQAPFHGGEQSRRRPGARRGARLRSGNGGKESRRTACDLDERPEPSRELRPRGAEGLHAALLGSLDRAWILEMPVQRAVRPSQAWALLARTVGQRDDVVEAAVDQLRDRLGASRMPVDADFGENSNSQRVNPAWARAGRKGVEIAPPESGEQGLGDLTACRVAVAHEQHADRGRTSIRSAVEIDSRKSPLEVDELDLEAIKVFALTCDLAALLLERRTQGGVGHLTFDEAIDQPPASAGARPRRRSARISVSRETSSSLYSR